jgi:hypothetical protein
MVHRDLDSRNDFVRFWLGEQQTRTDRNVVTFVNIKRCRVGKLFIIRFLLYADTTVC